MTYIGLTRFEVRSRDAPSPPSVLEALFGYQQSTAWGITLAHWAAAAPMWPPHWLLQDTTRLPLGVSVNMASYAAKALSHVSLQPLFLAAYKTLGTNAELFVQVGAGAGQRCAGPAWQQIPLGFLNPRPRACTFFLPFWLPGQGSNSAPAMVQAACAAAHQQVFLPPRQATIP